VFEGINGGDELTSIGWSGANGKNESQSKCWIELGGDSTGQSRKENVPVDGNRCVTQDIEDNL